MGYTGAYTMDLYCDGNGCLDPLTSGMPKSTSIVGLNFTECVNQAREARLDRPPGSSIST